MLDSAVIVILSFKLKTASFEGLVIVTFKPSSKMTKEQSRYTISECIGVRVVRVQDIGYDSIVKTIGEEKTQWKSKRIADEVRFFNSYNHQMKEANINRIYEDNDHVFLIEIKR